MNQRITCLLFVLLLMLPASFAFGQCISDKPAKPVPQFTPEAPGVSLWPIDGQTGDIKLRPADVEIGTPRNLVETLHPNQDSTAYNGLQVPGRTSGLELFFDVAAPGSHDEHSTQSDFVVVTYNAGVQVWSLVNNPERPARIVAEDGWSNDWLRYGSFAEISSYTNMVDVVEDGNKLLIGVSSDANVGFTIWVFNTSNSSMTQVYQDLNSATADVAMARDGNGDVYAYLADRTNGIRVYNVSDALSLPGGDCVDENGLQSCGIYKGTVGAAGRLTSYVSAVVVDGETYVAFSDGGTLGGLDLEIWHVQNPENPAASPNGNSLKRFDGLGTHIYSPELFQYDGHVYLAYVEKIAGTSPPEVMSLYQIDSCLTGCSSLTSLKAKEHIVNSQSSEHLLKFSYSEGTPFLHYGLSPGNNIGMGHERLWELGALPASFALNTLPELTDSDEPSTYNQGCDGTEIDYFADYYDRSDYGLSGFQPRTAVFTGPYLWRAAYTVLDVHVRGGESQTNNPSITPRLQSGGSINANTFWMDEQVELEADVLNCLAGSTDWCWDATLTNPNVQELPASGCDPSFDDEHSMTFLCQAAGRCADTGVTVEAWNMGTGCAETGLDPDQVSFNLKDPEVDATGLSTGGSSFPECQVVSLQASAEGRGAVEWAWLVDGEPISGCEGIVPGGTDLSEEAFACEWDSSGLTFDLLFADFFEDGTCENWSSGCPATFKSGVVKRASAERKGSTAVKAGGTVTVEFEVSAIGGPVLDSLFQSVTFNPVGDPSFNGGLSDPEVTGAGALLEAPAFDTTTWTWEIEDPDVPGSPCSFNASKNCTTEDTTVDFIEYVWQQAGTYSYKVSLSNCSSAGTVSATGSVTVSNAIPPEIVNFRVAPESIATGSFPNRPCCKPFPFTKVVCPINEAIDFEVRVADEGLFSFFFDWERTSLAETPVYVSANPVNQDGVFYTFSRTFSSNSPSPNYPISSIQFGNEVPLLDTLEFGSCP